MNGSTTSKPIGPFNPCCEYIDSGPPMVIAHTARLPLKTPLPYRLPPP